MPSGYNSFSPLTMARASSLVFMACSSCDKVTIDCSIKRGEGEPVFLNLKWLTSLAGCTILKIEQGRYRQNG